MSEPVWYVYQAEKQIGPFGHEQLAQMVDTKMISQDAYLFKVGWKDWRPLEDCTDELGVHPENSSQGPASPQRREGAPRATIAGRVIVHNNGQLVIGSGVNISSTGIFVETKDHIFTVGERLKLSVRCDGLDNPFNAIAQVVRFNSDPRYPVGYGLKFEGLDATIREEIAALVANPKGSSESKAAN